MKEKWNQTVRELEEAEPLAGNLKKISYRPIFFIARVSTSEVYLLIEKVI